MSSSVPSLGSATPLSEIPTLVHTLQSTLRSGKTKDVKWRKEQLKALAYMIQDNEKELCAAIKADLGRSANESYFVEISGSMNEIVEAVHSVEKWAKPERPSVDFMNKVLQPIIYKEPKGVGLILGTWNYPVSLNTIALVGAIAAGAPCIIKCSEVAPNVAALYQRLVAQYLDPTAYAVVTGEVDVINRLLEEPWGHIIYTGNARTARHVAAAAAKTLTPTTLELGGKNPVLIDPEVEDLDTTAKRILWAKRVNCGQTCIAPDYLVVTEDKHAALVSALQKQHAVMFPAADLSTDDYPRIVNQKHFDRLDQALERTSGKLVNEPVKDRNARLMGVAIVDNVDWQDELMKEEIFGPILPIVPVKSFDEVFEKTKDAAPLTMTVFSKSAKFIDWVRGNTASGSFLVNDLLMQHTVSELPFGGLNESGQGSYHGKRSFNIFTHERAGVTTPFWADFLFAVRYYPYTDGNIGMLRWTTKKINFARPKHLASNGVSGKDAGSSSGSGAGVGKAWRWVIGAALLALTAVNAERLIAYVPRYKLVKVQ